jgi:hypothetical protein
MSLISVLKYETKPKKNILNLVLYHGLLAIEQKNEASYGPCTVFLFFFVTIKI